MMLDVLLEIGRSFNHIESNSLRGTGDVRYCMLVSVCSTWGISVVLSYILGVYLHLGLLGVWIAFGTDEWCRGMLLIKRWWSKKMDNEVLGYGIRTIYRIIGFIWSLAFSIIAMDCTPKIVRKELDMGTGRFRARLTARLKGGLNLLLEINIIML